MAIAWARTRVIKKLSSHQPGAIKLGKRYGDALVCVRYRYDLKGTIRYTTVELLVDEMPVSKRNQDMQRMVALTLPIGEQLIRQLVIAGGGNWDAKRQVWYLAMGVVKRLRLEDRVIAE